MFADKGYVLACLFPLAESTAAFYFLCVLTDLQNIISHINLKLIKYYKT